MNNKLVSAVFWSRVISHRLLKRFKIDAVSHLLQNCWKYALRKCTNSHNTHKRAHGNTHSNAHCVPMAGLHWWSDIYLMWLWSTRAPLRSSCASTWVWYSLTAAASDTISASFTHAQTPRGKMIGERLLFYSTRDIIEISVKTHEGKKIIFKIISEYSVRENQWANCTYTMSRKKYLNWLVFCMNWS